mmetsp:Transcript_5567/g.14225  ORF Transcript_5567/g.14225 Transcript_5567/m.14225 type:complete len:500 (+) Transcript_5567:128-1627(+)
MFVSAGLGDVSPTRQCAAPPWDNRWTAGRSALAPAVPRISQRKRADDLARMCSARLPGLGSSASPYVAAAPAGGTPRSTSRPSSARSSARPSTASSARSSARSIPIRKAHRDALKRIAKRYGLPEQASQFKVWRNPRHTPRLGRSKSALLEPMNRSPANRDGLRSTQSSPGHRTSPHRTTPPAARLKDRPRGRAAALPDIARWQADVACANARPLGMTQNTPARSKSNRPVKAKLSPYGVASPYAVPVTAKKKPQRKAKAKAGTPTSPLGRRSGGVSPQRTEANPPRQRHDGGATSASMAAAAVVTEVAAAAAAPEAPCQQPDVGDDGESTCQATGVAAGGENQARGPSAATARPSNGDSQGLPDGDVKSSTAKPATEGPIAALHRRKSMTLAANLLDGSELVHVTQPQASGAPVENVTLASDLSKALGLGRDGKTSATKTPNKKDVAHLAESPGVAKAKELFHPPETSEGRPIRRLFSKEDLIPDGSSPPRDSTAGDS